MALAKEAVSRNPNDVWLPDWKDTPFWHDGLTAPSGITETLPQTVDVVVVGSGYTGLNAAIETARGSRSTLVLEAGEPGHGCSMRNGGQISTSIKPSYSKLKAKHGPARARAIRDEGKAALGWIEARIRDETIDCSFRRTGRFHAAHTPQHYEELAREAEVLAREDGIASHVVARADQRSELGTDRYYGGLVFPHHASLDPGRYHRGLLDTAIAAGAQVVRQCEVLAIERNLNGFEIRTSKGLVRAKDVAVATNGYTGGATPWLQRRVIPIGSYIIATEELPQQLVDQLFPTNRIASDTCKVVYYYRTSPDRKRILFGGRVSANETDTWLSGPKLYEDMCRIFPELRDYRISHSWMGTVAYTFDELPHTGVHDGMHYAMGFCGSGVSMASYLGMRMGQKVIGLEEGRTAFDDVTFSTRPLYTGKPWFLPPMVAWYRWRDRVQYERSKEAV